MRPRRRVLLGQPAGSALGSKSVCAGVVVCRSALLSVGVFASHAAFVLVREVPALHGMQEVSGSSPLSSTQVKHIIRIQTGERALREEHFEGKIHRMMAVWPAVTPVSSSLPGEQRLCDAQEVTGGAAGFWDGRTPKAGHSSGTRYRRGSGVSRLRRAQPQALRGRGRRVDLRIRAPALGRPHGQENVYHRAGR
jgi:hypothetical protein